MEQRLAALFATVENALDSSTYTYSDSDYLVRKALTEFLDGENALVASARKIQDSTEVVTSILNYIVSTDFSAEDPAEWYRKAMRIVVEFSDFAFRNEMSEDSARYSALLPEGHPRALNSITLTASAQRSALAEWMAADPRLDEEASAQVRKLYSLSDLDELDLEFEYLKAEAMVASGKMPEDLLPLTAAFNLTRAQRSAISAYLEDFRNRDRKGRFADEFGRLSLIFGDKDGGFFSKAPKIVGPGRGPNRVIVEFDGSDARIPKGLYDVDAAKGENVQAYLPTSAVKGLPKGREVVAEGDKQYAIGLDELLANRVELPLNWEKSGKGFKSKDGKFVAEPIKNSDAEKAIDRARERGDNLIIAGVGDGDAFDSQAEGGSFLIADAKGKTLGVAQDWAGIQEIAVANGADSGRDASPVSKPTTPEVAPDGAEGPSPDLDQDVDDDYDGDGYDPDTTPQIEKSKLSPSMLGEGYNFSKEGENSWVQDGVGSNGESYAVSKAPNGKWVVTERSGSGPDNQRERDLQSFDTAEEAFDFANGQGAEPNEFDEDWVSELMFDQSPDLDQNVTGPKKKLDAADFSPNDLENAQKYIDSANQAIFNNDRAKLNDIIYRAANDSNVSDDAYSALLKARDARDARDYEVENALAGGSREDVEALLEDPEYSGWASRLEDALAVDLDQEAPTLSEKQSEPASGKQYAFLSEFLAERQLDPATEQALKDAIANKNLNKAQASALIGIGRAADFKPDVDPTKPSERMLDSLQGYLATKDLAPSEIKEVLDSLQKDGSRDNVDALLNKLRRKKDKPVDLNQGVSGLTRHSDGSYSWEDDYNNINVNNTPRGWEVEYTSPSMEDGVNDWYYKSFASEEEALAFAEELLRQNQGDGGYGRAADNLFDRGGASADVDLDQDAKGTLTDAATDKQWDFLQSLLDGKKINNPELEAAVRSALADRNLTKGEVGAFIGQLRPLEDKPNVRREPSAKQIASIKRALLERDMTPEERKSMQDKLAAGLSFDEASEMLNDLKKRDITPEGMDNLLSELKSEQDIDTLRYLLDKPEYSKYRTDIKDALRQLALDTEDPYLQEFIDAREDVDLDQDVSSNLNQAAEYLDSMSDPDNWTDWSSFPEYNSPDGRLKIRAEGDPEGNFLEATLDGQDLDLDDDARKAILDTIESSNFYAGMQGVTRKDKERTAKDVADIIRESLADAQGGPDLDQNVTGRRYGNDWDIEPELFSPEDRDKYSKEISEINLAVNIGHYPTVKNLAEKYSNDSSLPENVKAEFLHTLETWLEYDAEVSKALEASWDEDEDSNDAKRKIDLFIGSSVYRPWWPLLADDSGRYNIVESKEAYDEVMDDLGLDLKDAMDRDVDLDQDVSNVSREVKQTVIDSLDDDFIVELDLGGNNYSRDGLDSYSWTSPNGRVKVSMESDGDTEAETSSTTWVLEVDGEEIAGGSFGLGSTKLSDEIFDALDISVSLTDEEEFNYRLKFAKAERDAELAKINQQSEGLDKILARMTPEQRADYENIKEQQRDLAESRYNRRIEGIRSQYGVDLDQDVSGSSTRDRLAEKLAEDLDALDSLAVDGDELKSYLEEFDRTNFAYTALEMVAQIENMSRYVNDPELKQRLSDLSSRLTDEIVNRFGVAEAAREDDGDILDLYDYSEKVRDEVAIYFETDADTIVEKLDENGYYGDNRSGGAEARISENEDGTYTARVDYDRDGEEQTFEDRDEALAWAANGVAKYNSNVIPNTYDKDIDLEEEAQNAKTDAEAAAFADRLDEIARDLDENRGDPRAARELRSYGERIRDMIEKRDRQRQSEVESEPLNSETMNEMATDPDLNPAGYADYVSDDLYKQLEASEKADPTGITNTTDGLPTLDSYESADGRVKVEIDYDADFDGDGFVNASSYTVTIDGVRVGGKSLSSSDDLAADVGGLIEEYFSKKA